MVNLEVVNQPIELEIVGTPSVQLEVLRQTVEIEAVAVQGLSGRDGIGSAYEHNQTTPSDVWVINHNLNYFPDVHVYVGAVEVVAEVLHLSNTTVQINLSFPRAGRARLS
jgi:hypothetical protein